MAFEPLGVSRHGAGIVVCQLFALRDWHNRVELRALEVPAVRVARMVDEAGRQVREGDRVVEADLELILVLESAGTGDDRAAACKGHDERIFRDVLASENADLGFLARRSNFERNAGYRQGQLGVKRCKAVVLV